MQAGETEAKLGIQPRGIPQPPPHRCVSLGESDGLSLKAGEGRGGEGRSEGSLVESKAGAVPSAPLSCMGNTSTNSFLKTDSR